MPTEFCNLYLYLRGSPVEGCQSMGVDEGLPVLDLPTQRQQQQHRWGWWRWQYD
jgi:hypothetical protein